MARKLSLEEEVVQLRKENDRLRALAKFTMRETGIAGYLFEVSVAEDGSMRFICCSPGRSKKAEEIMSLMAAGLFGTLVGHTPTGEVIDPTKEDTAPERTS